jgi:Zn-dependent metalloprotease
MKFFASVLIASALASAARLQVKPFGPAVPMVQSSLPLKQPLDGLNYLTEPTRRDPAEIAIQFAQENILNAAQGDFGLVVKNQYTDEHNGVTHVYAKQTFKGAEVVNGDLNVNVDKYGRVFSFGSSFFTGSVAQDQEAAAQFVMAQPLSPAEAVARFAEYVNVPKVAMASLTEMAVNDGAADVFPGNTAEEPVMVVSNVPFARDHKVYAGCDC